MSVAGQFSGEEGGNRIDMVDFTSGGEVDHINPDFILVNTSIGVVRRMAVYWS